MKREKLPSLVHYLRASVERDPEAEAVVHSGLRVKYGQLWRETVALARFFSGINRGDRVALLLSNSHEYIVAYYAVLAAGGVVVALNTAARARELSAWLQHSGARWLIAEANHPELGQLMQQVPASVSLVAVGQNEVLAHPLSRWDEVTAGSRGGCDIDLDIRQEAAAAIIYTSGTTGRPKGVLLSHDNLASNVNSILTYLQLSQTDRCLNVLPFYYSYGNSVLHTHLAAGGTLVLENSLVYVHEVLGRVAMERVTGFAGVPSTYALILSRVNLADYELSSLRYMTQAGGPMAPAQISKLRQALPHVKFFVMYGQTEATARLAYLPSERLQEKLGSVGVPIPDVQIEIRDEHGRPAPCGTTGEIWAAGPNIMVGYWKDPAATQEVLKEGWLKTGDLGYMDADGYVYIQGRSSDMIKSGAHRINPTDIEEVIAELDGVADVAVVGVPDEILGQAIKAVIVPRPNTSLTSMMVKAHCHARLASHKVPRYIEVATQIPKTSSGKTKRYLLVDNLAGEHSRNA
jgi:long-chain acyl-CoA synthetase